MDKNYFMNKVMNMAHRGGAGLFPENTLYAFCRAVEEYGVDVLEMDIWASKDGVLVVHHDETVERTTGGKGRICEMNLAEIKSLDAGFNFTTDAEIFPMRGKGLTIPTLGEVFETLPGIRMNLEIQQIHPPIEKKLYRLIMEHGRADTVLVAARFDGSRKRFASVNKASIATSASVRQSFRFLLLTRLGFAFICKPDTDAFQVPLKIKGLKVLSRRFIKAAHSGKIAVHAWIINDKKTMKRLIKMGVDGIITDFPDRLCDVLAELGHR